MLWNYILPLTGEEFEEMTYECDMLLAVLSVVRVVW